MADSLIKKLREPRVFDIAIFDLASAVIGTELIARYLGYPPYTGALAAVPLGVAAHWAFNVDTELNYKLGISSRPARE